MADKSFTLFELHTHDRLQIGPARLRAGDESESETEEEPEVAGTAGDRTTTEADAGSSTGKRVLAAVAAVGVVVLVARLVRGLLATDAEEVDLDLDVDDDEELVESDLGDD